MEETDLKNLLWSDAKRSSHRRWACLSEAQLAAYADRRLAGAAKSAVESHLADCGACLEQVSFLAQSADFPAPVAVPARLLVQARKLASEKRKTTASWGWRWSAATAAAACLLLAVSFIAALRLGNRPDSMQGAEAPLVAQQQREAEAIPLPPAAAPAPVTRSAAAPLKSPARSSSGQPKPRAAHASAPPIRGEEVNGLSPKLLSPQDGAALKRSAAEFRWQPIADAVFYEVFVVTAEGDLVFEKKSDETRLPLPAEASLAPGAKYFVWVRAYLREGKTAKSGVVSFRVVD